mgnify:CR=1 FL=1
MSAPIVIPTRDAPLKIKPSEYVQSIFMFEGKPYSLARYPFYRDIYDCDARRQVLMTGRQCAKSTYKSCRQVAFATALPGFRSAYFTPTRSQTSDFSNMRLQPLIYNTPLVRKFFTDRRLVSNVFNQRFTNGSQLMLRYAFLTADRVRGITTDLNDYDEYQDLIEEVVKILDQSLTTSQYYYQHKAGTPKRMNNSLSRAFMKSTMNFWFVKCRACNHDHPLISPANIGPNGPVCAKCSGTLYPAVDGRWIRTAPLSASCTEGEGFHISKLMLPLSEPAMADLWIHARSDPAYIIMNEILGMPFERNDCPITEPEVQACCDPNYSMDQFVPKKYKGQNLFMGVDWGYGIDSYTVLWVGVPQGDRFRILYCKRFDGMLELDPDYQVETIARMAVAFRVKAIGADWGVGVDKAIMLTGKLKNMGYRPPVILFQANSGGQPLIWTPTERIFHYSKTRVAAERFREMKLKQVIFPKYDEFKTFADDILAIFVDYRTSPQSRGVMYYDHSLPDDAFWAHAYCRMVADVMIYGEAGSDLAPWTV